MQRRILKSYSTQTKGQQVGSGYTLCAGKISYTFLCFQNLNSFLLYKRKLSRELSMCVGLWVLAYITQIQALLQLIRGFQSLSSLLQFDHITKVLPLRFSDFSFCQNWKTERAEMLQVSLHSTYLTGLHSFCFSSEEGKGGQTIIFFQSCSLCVHFCNSSLV